MRELGYRVVDLLVERWRDLPEKPAWVGASPDHAGELFSLDPPEEGRPYEEVLDEAVGGALHHAARLDHPRFFAFVPSAPTWPGIVAEALTAGYNVFQGTWLEAAGPTRMELAVVDWFRSWLGLPADAGGLLTTGGSSANLMAAVLAREAAEAGSDGVVYLGEEAHSSLFRGARIAGFPAHRVRTLPVDDAFRTPPEAARRQIRRDRDAGLEPALLTATAGTTNTGSIDPLDELAAVCAEEGLWFHVDAAYGGFISVTPEGERLLTGIQEADSVTLDPHKWFFQPYEAGCLLVRDVPFLEETFRVLPPYLQDAESSRGEVNFADRGVELTRSFRALKIWLSVQVLGVRAFRQGVSQGLQLARRAEQWIGEAPHLEASAPGALGVVPFRFNPRNASMTDDELEAVNRRLQEDLMTSGYAMVSSTRLRGRYTLRLCVLGHRSRWEDVKGTLAWIQRQGLRLIAGGGGGPEPPSGTGSDAEPGPRE